MQNIFIKILIMIVFKYIYLRISIIIIIDKLLLYLFFIKINYLRCLDEMMIMKQFIRFILICILCCLFYQYELLFV
jgi:hypothetical protein